jgi:cytoskeletal protein RodZ
VTATGLIVGTPAYMAPEQARAAKTLTPAVDVFSLGGVIAFAATGEPPFGGGSGTDLLFRIVHEPPDLAPLRAVDAALADVIEACLAKDPANRPLAAELADIAAWHAGPWRPQWPTLIAERISARAEFAATPPRTVEAGAGAGEDEGVTEFEPPEEEANEAASPVAAEAEAVLDKPKKEHDRRRRRLVLVVPLILATGTVGTLIAMSKVPFVTSGRNDLNPTVTISHLHLTAKATSSASSRATASPSAHPSSSASASGFAPSTAIAHSRTAISTRTGGSGSGTRTTAAVGGPAAGPSSSEGLVSGSEVAVNDCAGWLDFSNPVFYGYVSAGSAASCQGTFTYSSSVQSTTTADLSASDGGKSSANSCNGCWYVGTWTITAKICVWNKDDATEEKCSATYTYESTTNKITSG